MAEPCPTRSCHQPGVGSEVVAVTCRWAEMPPRTTITGAPGGPEISQAEAREPGDWGRTSCAGTGRTRGRGLNTLPPETKNPAATEPPGTSPSPFSICLTWLQAAANDHGYVDCE